MTKVEVKPQTRKGHNIYRVLRGREHVCYVDYYTNADYLWHVVRHSDQRIIALGVPDPRHRAREGAGDRSREPAWAWAEVST